MQYTLHISTFMPSSFCSFVSDGTTAIFLVFILFIIPSLPCMPFAPTRRRPPDSEYRACDEVFRVTHYNCIVTLRGLCV